MQGMLLCRKGFYVGNAFMQEKLFAVKSLTGIFQNGGKYLKDEVFARQLHGRSVQYFQ